MTELANTPSDTSAPRPMKRQVRVALVLFIAALATGWLGLRRGNAALEEVIATASAATSAMGAANTGGAP